MGLWFSKRKRVGKNGNVTMSNSGVSYSHRFGPLTLNSRGRGSLRLGKRFSLHF